MTVWAYARVRMLMKDATSLFSNKVGDIVMYAPDQQDYIEVRNDVVVYDEAICIQEESIAIQTVIYRTTKLNVFRNKYIGEK